MAETSTPQSKDLAAQQARRTARQNRLRIDQAERALRRELITPEGAVLNLKLGTASARAGAFVIDFIIFMVVAIIFISILIYLDSTGLVGGDDGANIATALLLFFWFVFRNCYWIFFELGRKAATPGKRLLGLRVAARNGGNLTIGAILARNFSREIEVFLPFSIVFNLLVSQADVSGFINLLIFIWSACFLFFPVFNKDNLRLGDIIAGTWVIQVPKTKLLSDISSSASNGNSEEDENPAPRFAFTQAQLDVYGIHELQVLETVLRNKDGPSLPKVAEKIRTKIGWQRIGDDRQFLEAYYAALRGHLEQKLLFGQRKEDKYDH